MIDDANSEVSRLPPARGGSDAFHAGAAHVSVGVGVEPRE